MNTLYGSKVGMSRVFSQTGSLIPVTMLRVGKNILVDKKTMKKDGYDSLVISYGEIMKTSSITKPFKGQFKKSSAVVTRHLSEVRMENESDFALGHEFDLSMFKVGDIVDVQGKSAGKGFSGAIRRWNFKIGPMSHGAGYPHRYQGSLETGRGGASAQKVWKGKKMAGRHGNKLTTVIALEIVGILSEENVMLVKGAVPGHDGGVVRIRKTNRKRVVVLDPCSLAENNNE